MRQGQDSQDDYHTMLSLTVYIILCLLNFYHVKHLVVVNLFYFLQVSNPIPGLLPS